MDLTGEWVRFEVCSPNGSSYQESFRSVSAGEAYCVLSSRSQGCWVESPRFPTVISEDIVGGCVAPMPGKIVRVLVAQGDSVDVGTALVVLEAMKMEQTLEASGVGTVSAVHVAEGDLVSAQDTLVEIDYDET